MPNSLVKKLSEEIHVYKLHWTTDSLVPRESCLGGEEISRAFRFKKQDSVDSFIYFHTKLRQILASYLECDPANIDFEIEEFGKPIIKSNMKTAGIFKEFPIKFNLSHSGTYGVVAVSLCEIGIDLEHRRRKNDILAIAERFFAPVEFKVLKTMADLVKDKESKQWDDLQDMFFTMWVRKESFVKAHGGGIASGFKNFSVSTENFGTKSILQSWTKGKASDWLFEDINLAKSIFTSVCYKREVFGNLLDDHLNLKIFGAEL